MRVFDAELVNRMANAPGIPETLGAERFDFTDAIADQSNIFLLCDGALGIFSWSAPRVYEGHLIFSQECRRRRAVNAAAVIRDTMLSSHADMIWAQPPLTLAPIRKLLRLIGFEHAGFATHPLVGEVERFLCRQS